MQDIMHICIRRGGVDVRQSHNQWLSTISQSPNVISMSFVPITSLLSGVKGNGFLSHAVNLYLRCEYAYLSLWSLCLCGPCEHCYLAVFGNWNIFVPEVVGIILPASCANWACGNLSCNQKVIMDLSFSITKSGLDWPKFGSILHSLKHKIWFW